MIALVRHLHMLYTTTLLAGQVLDEVFQRSHFLYVIDKRRGRV
jgi:hypothetical protein